MLRKKALAFLPGLLLAGALIGLNGCSPYASSQPGGQPDSVHILIDEPQPQPVQTKPVVTLTDPALTRQLYATIYALPQMPTSQGCTADLGPHYTLTFSQGGTTLVTVLAMRDGCHPVSIGGETQDRQATPAFWGQLDSAIYAAEPLAHPDALAIEHAPDPARMPQTAQIADAAAAQRLYNAILALKWLPQGSACQDIGIPAYQLVFQTANQMIPAVLRDACNSIDLEGAYQSRGGWYAMTDQFKQFFQQTIAGAAFAPASPDHLALTVESPSTSSQTSVDDAQMMQRLYQTVFTLQPAQPQPDCPSGADKIAGIGKWYTLNFSQWSLPILQLNAYEGSCALVSFSLTQQALQGDQQFWDLLHQAAGQQ